MLISFDTETTGTDFNHGARPFFFTSYDELGIVHFWEWDVDPLTREPIVCEEDIEEITERLSPTVSSGIVLQNGKFDVKALSFIRPEWGTNWRWEGTHDTLIAGHLLASNQPHNLTDMAVHYLGINIEPLEVRLHKAVEECRRRVRRDYPDWAIAKKGRPDMPSAGEKVWKYDTWLPRALAKHLWETTGDEEYNPQNPDLHPWWVVLREYANADSQVTHALWNEMWSHLKRRGLVNIYKERMRVLPVVYNMEMRGITINSQRVDTIRKQFVEDVASAERVCASIAESYNHELEFPKSGANGSIRSMFFDEDKLALPVVKRSEKTGQPSLDKYAMTYYAETLPPRSKAGTFVRNLMTKRKRDTSINYLDGYRRFWLPRGGEFFHKPEDWYWLFPSLNPTGSDTLRFTSENPNEQNISKQEGGNLRFCFGPPPGREWWSMDAKNIELRIPAYEAGEDAMIELFERPNDPPYYGSNHMLVFDVLHPELFAKHGKDCKKVYASTWYQWVKNGNFGVQYGAGKATADAAYHMEGAYEKVKAKFAKMTDLNNRMIAHAERYGYVETIPDKSVDPLHGYPLFCTRTDFGKILTTVPLNYHVQGTAMWWTMKAMNRCEAQLREWRRQGFDAHIAMQVHDEMVFDLPAAAHPLKNPKRSNLGRIKVLKRLMEQGGEDINIPTPVGVEYHDSNWADGVTLEI